MRRQRRYLGIAVGLAVLAATCSGLVPSMALAEGAAPPLFELAGGALAAMSDAQARQLGAYRAQRSAAQVTVVRLSTDVLAAGGTVSLNLPAADDAVQLDQVRVEQRGPNNFSWFGARSDGQADAILVARGTDVVGTIRSGGKLYRLRPLGDAVQALIQVDTARLPPEEPRPVRELQHHRAPMSRPPAGPRSGSGDSCSGYDVIVAYTVPPAVGGTPDWSLRGQGHR